MPGDSLVTYDQALERLQLFDSAGTLLRSLQVRSSWPEFEPAEMIGVLDNRRIAMMYYGVGTELRAGVSRWPPEMAVTFDIATGVSDSIVVVPGEEVQVTPREGGGFGYYRLPFRKENDFAVGQGKLAVISNEAIVARVFSVDRRLVGRGYVTTPFRCLLSDWQGLHSGGLDGRNGRSTRSDVPVRKELEYPQSVWSCEIRFVWSSQARAAWQGNCGVTLDG
jgi:hypothetical protein